MGQVLVVVVNVIKTHMRKVAISTLRVITNKPSNPVEVALVQVLQQISVRILGVRAGIA